MSASLDRRLGDRWTVGAALGASVAGSLDVGGQTFTESPGPLAALTASFRPLDEGDVAPFVLLTGAVTGAVAWTTPPGGGTSSTSLTALDVRLGAIAGKTIAHVVSPYLLARAFGGPVFWTYGGASATGTDASHYQLGGGVAVRAGRFDLVVEGVPLGELAVVGGVGVAF